MSNYSGTSGDFNGDGENELLWFYHGGREAEYYYRDGDDILKIDIIGELSAYFDDWENISADPESVREGSLSYSDNPESVTSDILKVDYQSGGADYSALISFTQDEIIVSAGHGR